MKRACYILDMRIVVGGDWFWSCNVLATAIVRRLVTRYGADIVIALGGGNGVDQSFAVACRALGVAIDYRPVELARGRSPVPAQRDAAARRRALRRLSALDGR
jgi:hypothetical protein